MSIYFDHAATTPLDAEVKEAMLPYLDNLFGNPSSIHSFGRETRAAIDQARSQVAQAIGAADHQLIFTSGGTEADNLALIGTMLAQPQSKKHVITSQVEHHAVLDACRFLEHVGYEVTYIPVDHQGIVKMDQLEAAIRPETALISILHGNNEVGTLQPIEQIGKLAREQNILFHVDAVQSFGSEKLDVSQLPVDLLTLSSHKIYGPKGVGALYVRDSIRLMPRAHGGAQERRRRAGTENVAGIVGFGKAAALVVRDHEARHKHLITLKEAFLTGLKAQGLNVVFNGAEHALPHIVNVSFIGLDTETLLIQLDLEGIAASSGSACTSGTLSISHVLEAMHLPDEVMTSAIRFSFGKDNTLQEIEAATKTIANVVRRLER
jgi:cysteine desulfurase